MSTVSPLLSLRTGIPVYEVVGGRKSALTSVKLDCNLHFSSSASGCLLLAFNPFPHDLLTGCVRTEPALYDRVDRLVRNLNAVFREILLQIEAMGKVLAIKRQQPRSDATVTILVLPISGCRAQIYGSIWDRLSRSKELRLLFMIYVRFIYVNFGPLRKGSAEHPRVVAI